MPSSLAQLVELIERALLAVLSTLLGLPITVLYICHRLQHVDHFDLVLVLDEGSGPPTPLQTSRRVRGNAQRRRVFAQRSSWGRRRRC